MPLERQSAEASHVLGELKEASDGLGVTLEDMRKSLA